MWTNPEDASSPEEKEKMIDVQSKMETILDDAVLEFDDEGVCVIVLYQVECGLRMAHISNVKKKFLIEAMRQWIKTQDEMDESNHFNG